MKMEWGDGIEVDTDLLSDEARAEHRQTCNKPYVMELMKKKDLDLAEALEFALCYAIRQALQYPDGPFAYIAKGYDT
jgi:hypothetical protein